MKGLLAQAKFLPEFSKFLVLFSAQGHAGSKTVQQNGLT